MVKTRNQHRADSCSMIQTFRNSKLPIFDGICYNFLDFIHPMEPIDIRVNAHRTEREVTTMDEEEEDQSEDGAEDMKTLKLLVYF